jgi:N-methylhydantoinase A
MTIDEAPLGGGPSSTRAVYAGGRWVDAPVRARRSIGTAAEPGPLLVDEYDTTVVVPPGWSARLDEATASLILERTG